MSDIKVWIDQDLCTGDGLCAEIAPDVFFGMDDGLYYVKESARTSAPRSCSTARPTRPAPRHGPGPRGRSGAGDRVRRGVPGRVHLHRRSRVGR